VEGNAFLVLFLSALPLETRIRHGRDRMIVGFTTTYAISASEVVSSNPAQGRCTRYSIMW